MTSKKSGGNRQLPACIVASLDTAEDEGLSPGQRQMKIPYNCLSSSPDGRLVIMGAQDSIRIVSVKPSGLKEVRSHRISQYFQATKSAGAITGERVHSFGEYEKGKRQDVRNLFSKASSQNMPSRNHISVTVTDVAWSITQDDPDDIFRNSLADPLDGSMKSGGGAGSTENHNLNHPFQIFSLSGGLRMADDSLIATAGSNGVVLVWRACDLLTSGIFPEDRGREQKKAPHDLLKQYYKNHKSGSFGGGFGAGKSSPSPDSTVGHPEAILVEHSKAVKLAWHPRLPGLLLTASLDGTAKLWERTPEIDLEYEAGKNKKSNTRPSSSRWNWLAGAISNSQDDEYEYSSKNFTWKCKHVFKPNCGAIRDVRWNNFNDDMFAMVTQSGFLVVYHILVSHRPTVRIAAHAREATTLDWHPTKPYTIATGGVDRTVKVWDLESDLSFEKSLYNVKFNGLSHRSTGESTGSNSDDISISQRSPKSENGISLDHSYHGNMIQPNSGQETLNRSIHNMTIGQMPLNDASGRKRLQPFNQSIPRAQKAPKHIHELSIGAQVGKIQWRPPRNHIFPDGTIIHSSKSSLPDNHDAMIGVATTIIGTSVGFGKVYLFSCHRPFMPLSVIDGHREKSVSDFVWLDTPDIAEEEMAMTMAMTSPRKQQPSHESLHLGTNGLSGTWQHVMTVGMDGECLVQSFCRGERPISNVPPSAFSIANLSPFQEGYGSLQIIAAHQFVPSGKEHDYNFCGLRQDKQTAQAPGIFYEPDLSVSAQSSEINSKWDPIDCTNVELAFSTTDAGDIKDVGKISSFDEIAIAPEVVHLSRFASGYKLDCDEKSPTKAAVCQHNAKVAKELSCKALAQMWEMLASILEGCDTEDISELSNKFGFSGTALSFVLLPTLKSLLLERADAGDVQTCVIICEVMEVIPRTIATNSRSQSSPSTPTLSVPGLDLILVRQWYLSYIELLQQMCMFSHATSMIRRCRDPEISKLNQISTTFHEACPTCSSPLEGKDKSCRKCRQKVGLCFLCHERVKGVFVWCPGCGHGGHLEHALEWFGGGDTPLNEFCPTGCGHKCNLFRSPIPQNAVPCPPASSSLGGSSFANSSKMSPMLCYETNNNKNVQVEGTAR